METGGFILAILSSVLALMALPTVFQMLFGAPKVRAEYHAEMDERNVLYIVLRNLSLSANWLLAIGVFRCDARIRCSYSIVTLDNEMIDSGIQLIRFSHGTTVVTGSLGEYDWATLDCITQFRENKISVAGYEWHGDSVIITPGIYKYKLNLHVSGRRILLEREFEVFKDKLEWLAFPAGYENKHVITTI